ncbi:hypothetical protein AVEN_190416-1 [Araneus ventricosus]|uniref:Uncharacterized protein n=1 Tax=Araneus ventricosus TaxID=182803 RepID=A0A4Y2LC44_ARAVE|nr:hypothetical protein AVEN_190416-1 [Araneus ventricosus]
MSGRRISKQALASSGGVVMVDFWVPPPVIVCASYGRSRAVARWLATRTSASALKAIAAAVIQISRMLRQGVVSSASRRLETCFTVYTLWISVVSVGKMYFL